MYHAVLVSSHAVFWAVAGGSLWGFGQLGRKCGVSDQKCDLYSQTAFTCLVYGLGAVLLPSIDFLTTDFNLARQVAADDEWRSSVPWLILSGCLSSLGGLFGASALGMATRNESCLVSLVEAGLYSVLSALLIIVVLGERPAVTDYAAGVLIILGTLALNIAYTDDDDGEKKSLTQDDGDNSGALPQYGAANSSEARRGSTSSSLSMISAMTASKKQSMTAYTVAVLASLLWSFGILGKRYSATLVPNGLEKPGSAVTYACYSLASLTFSAMVFLGAAACRCLELEGIKTWLQTKAPKVFLSGAVAGAGGVLVTYALTLASGGALISLIADGVYTLCGAFYIAAVYQERPNVYQLAGAFLVLLALVVVQAKHVF